MINGKTNGLETYEMNVNELKFGDIITISYSCKGTQAAVVLYHETMTHMGLFRNAGPIDRSLISLPEEWHLRVLPWNASLRYFKKTPKKIYYGFVEHCGHRLEKTVREAWRRHHLFRDDDLR